MIEEHKPALAGDADVHAVGVDRLIPGGVHHIGFQRLILQTAP